MKTLQRILPLIFGLLISTTIFSQAKIGHINSQELLQAMPESDSAQKKLERLAQQHQLTLEEMTVEFNKKLTSYQENLNEYSDLVRASKEADLSDLQQRIQAFQQNAEQEIQQKRMQLFQPIQEKALNAVNEVAEENGFTYILDSGVGVVVYSAPDADDIMPLVKVKLGLK